MDVCCSREQVKEFNFAPQSNFLLLGFFCQYVLRFSPYLNRAVHRKLSNLNELQMLNPGISSEDQSKNQSTLNPKEQGEKNNRST